MTIKNVRNFWVELEVDGVKTKVASGPPAALGGFCVTIYVRDKGNSKRAMVIRGTADADGELELKAQLDDEFWAPGDGQLVALTER